MADLGSLLGAAGIGGAIGQAIVRLELDTTKYTAEMEAAQAKTVAGTNTMSGGMSKFSSLATTGLAAAGLAAVAFGASSVKAFMDSERAMAQTEAVLKSTGGQANVTSQDVLLLADSLRDISGVDDEVIQASENLLLTFRDVRNEAGAGNDIFNQTERAILDMATAMNNGAVPSLEDMNSTTIQVGKALNDPIQGMTALRRVGVTFNETQVETITRLQESGDLMGAQKIVLEELRKEFGGAAKAAGDTFAGQLAKLATEFGDLQEAVGALIVPLLQGLLPVLRDLVTVLQFAARGMEDFDEATRNATTGIAESELHLASWATRFTGQIPFIGKTIEMWDRSREAIDEASGASGRHLDIVGTLSDAFRERLAPSVEDTSDQMIQFAHKTSREIHDWAESVKESFDTYVLALEESEDAQADTARGFRAATTDMLQDARALSRAMREIAGEKWVNEEYIAFLSEQGPEWLVGFAELTRTQQEKAQEAWRISTEKTDKAKDSLDRIIGVLKDLDNGTSKHTVIIDYRYEGFDPTKPGMSTSAQQR